MKKQILRVPNTSVIPARCKRESPFSRGQRLDPRLKRSGMTMGLLGALNVVGVISICAVMGGLITTPQAFANTITGKVVFAGEPPAQEVLKMDADPSCKAMHTTPAFEEAVVVNDNGTLRNVFVYVKEGLEGQAFAPPAEPAVIDQTGCQYVPHVLGVQAGQPLELRNSDATLHNVHAMPKVNKQFNLGMPIKGMKLKKQFAEPEIMVKFKCDVHPWMNAYIGVLNHPYFSVTGTDGSFNIDNLPDGDYVIEAWHEQYGTAQQSVTVSGGAAQNAIFTFAG